MKTTGSGQQWELRPSFLQILAAVQTWVQLDSCISLGPFSIASMYGAAAAALDPHRISECTAVGHQW